MRLWSIDIIDVLPRQQLLSQWREINCLFVFGKRISHILINFVYDYDETDLYRYSLLVLNECKRRGYKVNGDKMKAYFAAHNVLGTSVFYNRPFAGKMTDRYLTQCYFNLQEKYDCGGVSEEEWQKIEQRARKRVWEWVKNNLA